MDKSVLVLLNLDICSGLSDFELGGIFIMYYLLTSNCFCVVTFKVLSIYSHLLPQASSTRDQFLWKSPWENIEINP